MFPKTGKKLHQRLQNPAANGEFEKEVAAALKAELGSTHQAVKTVMSWTGASERTVKHWLAGTHGPNGPHLIALARHSEEVMMFFLAAAGRSSLLVGAELFQVRCKLSEAIEVIDAFYPTLHGRDSTIPAETGSGEDGHGAPSRRR
jgi:hypothetical protein